LIDNLPLAAGKAKSAEGKGRIIGPIVAHMHNVRVMGLKAAKVEEIPAQLDRASVTPGQAVRALENSRHARSVVLSLALACDGRVKGFSPRRRGFSRPFDCPRCPPPRPDHELARQLGHPLPQKAMFGMWE
jgi:hypothetical protein